MMQQQQQEPEAQSGYESDDEQASVGEKAKHVQQGPVEEGVGKSQETSGEHEGEEQGRSSGEGGGVRQQTSNEKEEGVGKSQETSGEHEGQEQGRSSDEGGVKQQKSNEKVEGWGLTEALEASKMDAEKMIPTTGELKALPEAMPVFQGAPYTMAEPSKVPEQGGDQAHQAHQAHQAYQAYQAHQAHQGGDERSEGNTVLSSREAPVVLRSKQGLGGGEERKRSAPEDEEERRFIEAARLVTEVKQFFGPGQPLKMSGGGSYRSYEAPSSALAMCPTPAPQSGSSTLSEPSNQPPGMTYQSVIGPAAAVIAPTASKDEQRAVDSSKPAMSAMAAGEVEAVEGGRQGRDQPMTIEERVMRRLKEEFSGGGTGGASEAESYRPTYVVQHPGEGGHEGDVGVAASAASRCTGASLKPGLGQVLDLQEAAAAVVKYEGARRDRQGEEGEEVEGGGGPGSSASELLREQAEDLHRERRAQALVRAEKAAAEAEARKEMIKTVAWKKKEVAKAEAQLAEKVEKAETLKAAAFEQLEKTTAKVNQKVEEKKAAVMHELDEKIAQAEEKAEAILEKGEIEKPSVLSKIGHAIGLGGKG